MKKTISIFFPLFFALCTFCESANADVRIGLPRVTVPISPDIRVVPQPQYVEPTIVVPLPGYYYYDYPGYYYPRYYYPRHYRYGPPPRHHHHHHYGPPPRHHGGHGGPHGGHHGGHHGRHHR